MQVKCNIEIFLSPEVWLYAYWVQLHNFLPSAIFLKLTLNVQIATEVVCFSPLLKCLRSLTSMANSVDQDQAVCSGSTLFASILNLSVFVADEFSRQHFQMHFFLDALRVNFFSNNSFTKYHQSESVKQFGSRMQAIWSGLQIKVRIGKSFSLFRIQNICCGYSKEPSQWDGSFEHPKHMLKLMVKKLNKILRK